MVSRTIAICLYILRTLEIKNVGAGLLAKAVCQSQVFQLIHRIREQARSHRGLWLYFSNVFSCSIAASPNGNTGKRGSPASNPVKRNPALIVAGKPPLRMNSSNGNWR